MAREGGDCPVISDTGTGRSIYYLKSNLLELAAMSYWLPVGLSFDIASTTLKKLKDQEPELFTSGKGKRFMLLSQVQERSPLGVLLAEPLEEKVSLELVEFDRKKAMSDDRPLRVYASLDKGQPVILVWLDKIYQQQQQKLKA